MGKIFTSLVSVALSGILGIPIYALPESCPSDLRNNNQSFTLEKGWCRGSSGKRGHRGHRGSRGPQGHHGKRGHRGRQGLIGHSGPTGPQGNPGQQGPLGPTGEAGETGVTSTVPGTTRFSDITNPLIWEDFISGSTSGSLLGSLGWDYSGEATIISGEVHHPGIVRIHKAYFGWLHLNDTLTGVTTFAKPIDLEMVVRSPDGSGTNNSETRPCIGLFNINNLNGVYLTISDAGTWMFKAYSASHPSESITEDTGISVNAEDWVKIKIHTSTLSGQMYFNFYLETSSSTYSSNASVPFVLDAMNYGVFISNDTSPSTIDVDYASIGWEGLER